MSGALPTQGLDHALDVFFGTQQLGRLQFDPGQEQFGFAYSALWRQHARRFQRSPHVPLDGEASAMAVRRFFDNLLPEGRLLDVVSSFTQVQKSNTFGLIRVLGRALSFLPAGQLPQAQEPQRRRVTLAELQQRIDDRNRIPFAIWDDKVRMSVAGCQDKLLVLREGDALSLADGSLSSMHILKPAPPERQVALHGGQ